MTEEQKEILIGKMIDNPSALTDAEIETILHDPEMRDIYRMSVSVSSAFRSYGDYDPDKEWSSFKSKIRRPKSLWIRRTTWAAAVIAATVLLGGVLIKLSGPIDTHKHTVASPLTEVISEPAESKPATPLPADSISAESVESATIRHKVSREREKRHIAKSRTSSRKVSADTRPVDVEEYLRIQQARIDNDIAVQNAEALSEEYADLLAILEARGNGDMADNNVIGKLTMQ